MYVLCVKVNGNIFKDLVPNINVNGTLYIFVTSTWNCLLFHYLNSLNLNLLIPVIWITFIKFSLVVNYMESVSGLRYLHAEGSKHVRINF